MVKRPFGINAIILCQILIILILFGSSLFALNEWGMIIGTLNIPPLYLLLKENKWSRHVFTLFLVLDFFAVPGIIKGTIGGITPMLYLLIGVLLLLILYFLWLDKNVGQYLYQKS